ncbi:MAG TPA: class I adenylate-forming enzyme family protein [Alphaproteobacteria bacterium]|jgi:acyl-CoA synthetase (AMP-forming)/AMP-acid ligase II|nr:class I adenylate-forming enzyme family protein [Alphaproteobacteria bacterium]
MSVLDELDQIRSYLSMPGQPFELVDETVGGIALKVYRHLPPNLSHFIVQAAAFGDRTFIVNGERRLSYAQAIGEAAGLANLLRERYGVGAGVRAAVAMRNSPEWIIATLAILLAGATAALINSRGSADEMAHALADTECSLVIADRRRSDALAGRFYGRTLLAIDGGFADENGTRLAIVPAQAVPSAATLNDPALILFTSGTTGRAKGATLTHRGVEFFLFGMRHNGAAYLARAAKAMGTDPATLAASMPQQATLAIFPLFHVSGASAMLLGAVMNGSKMVIMDRWNAADALALIAKERITMLQGPPSIFWDVLACPDLPSIDISSVTNVGIGGQATPPNLLVELRKFFPRAAPGGGFGQTETNGSIAAGTGDEYMANPHGSGRVLPGVEVRIVGDDGQDRPLGEAGEIWTRSALNMVGYWNQPEATRAALREDGWLRTGDIGYLDENRFIVIVDRKKDVIICGGENIYCAELERVFQTYPGVLEVAAFGVADDRLGERAVLAVVPQAGATPHPDGMRAFGRQHLADYKIPSEIVLFDTPFVRNAVGKVDKAALRKRYLDRRPS